MKGRVGKIIARCREKGVGGVRTGRRGGGIGAADVDRPFGKGPHPEAVQRIVIEPGGTEIGAADGLGRRAWRSCLGQMERRRRARFGMGEKGERPGARPQPCLLYTSALSSR